MPRNGTGQYNPPAGNPVSSGTIIAANWANPLVADLGNEITNSIAKDGQTPMIGPLKLPDGVATAPAITFSGETNSGMYRDGAGTVAISAGSVPVAKFKDDGSATFIGNIASASNGVYNIGSATNKFGTIYGTAVTAQYADLAERYAADSDIPPGTVVEYTGNKKVGVCNHDMCTKVAGVISTAPAVKMNSDCTGKHVVDVAMTGRVPCNVVGPVKAGDLMVSAGMGFARAEANPRVGSVIGKALEDFSGGAGVIEVAVGVR